MQEKIIELETKYSFQEDLLQELNKQVIRQQKLLDAVLDEVQRLKEQLAELQAGNSHDENQIGEDEKPPHY